MSNNKRAEMSRRRRQTERYYVDGNTARQLRTEVQRRRKPEPEPEMQPKVIYQKRQPSIDRGFMIFTVCAVMVAVFSIIVNMYTNVQLTTQKTQVASLQSDLKSAQEENGLLQETLNTTINLEEVYRIATEQLGMVYASEDQIIYYDSSNSDYIRQYDTIPKK